MPLLAENAVLSVGNAVIDNDHRHLISLLNDLHAAIGEDSAHDVHGTVLSDLIEYTQEPFKREESVMQAMHYAEFFEHKQEHEKLTREVLDLQSKFISGEKRISVSLLQLLIDWLFQHLVTVDNKLAQAIRNTKPEAKYQT
jgi:hemerythrin-like metal-binding protein